MSLPGDPANATITHTLTDQGGGNFRLRRLAKSGMQFFMLDVTNANVDLLRLYGQAAEAYGDGTFVDQA